MGKNSSVLLYGGGLDSTILAGYLARKGITPVLLHFDYGQKAADLERVSQANFAHHLGLDIEQVSIPMLTSSAIMSKSDKDSSDIPSNVLEGRNLIFISYAASYAASIGAHTVYLGYHKEPVNSPFKDAGVDFFNAVRAVISAGFNAPINVEAPLIEYTRQDIFNWAWLNDPFLCQAHTCYEDVPGGCGKCSHCVQKAEMLRVVGEGNVRTSIC